MSDLDLDAIRAELADNTITDQIGVDYYYASTVDRAVAALLARLAEVEAERDAARAVRAYREKELLDLKGPCSTCRLHYAHSGPCDIQGPRP